MQCLSPDILDTLKQLREAESWITKGLIYLQSMKGNNLTNDTIECFEKLEKSLKSIGFRLELHDCDVHASIVY